MDVSVNIRKDGKYCVSFERNDGSKNNVYLTEEEIMKLADATGAAANNILDMREAKLLKQFEEAFNGIRKDRKGRHSVKRGKKIFDAFNGGSIDIFLPDVILKRLF